jgi:hypothetical protein
MKAVLALLGPALLAGALALSTTSVVGRDPAVAKDPRDVTWGNQVFDRPQELAGWLSSRGVSYQIWAERHPTAAHRQKAGATTRTGGAG